MLRYIVIELKTKEWQREVPIIFPCVLNDREMFSIIREFYGHHSSDVKCDIARSSRTCKCVSAGSVYIQDSTFHCSGESEILGLRSRGDVDGSLLTDYCRRNDIGFIGK
jgi:hypothetical protein